MRGTSSVLNGKCNFSPRIEILEGKKVMDYRLSVQTYVADETHNWNLRVCDPRIVSDRLICELRLGKCTRGLFPHIRQSPGERLQNVCSIYNPPSQSQSDGKVNLITCHQPQNMSWDICTADNWLWNLSLQQIELKARQNYPALYYWLTWCTIRGAGASWGEIRATA